MAEIQQLRAFIFFMEWNGGYDSWPVYISFLRRGLARLGTRGCLTISTFFWAVSFRIVAVFNVVRLVSTSENVDIPLL